MVQESVDETTKESEEYKRYWKWFTKRLNEQLSFDVNQVLDSTRQQFTHYVSLYQNWLESLYAKEDYFEEWDNLNLGQRAAIIAASNMHEQYDEFVFNLNEKQEEIPYFINWFLGLGLDQMLIKYHLESSCNSPEEQLSLNI